MNNVTISKDVAINAMQSTNIKSSKLVEKTQIHILDYVAPDGDANRAYLACKSDAGRIRVPLREFMNMTNAGEGEVFKTNEDGKAMLPLSFVVKSSTDRESTRTGEKVYATWMYEASDAFIQAIKDGDGQAPEGAYEAMVKSGRKEQYKDADAVQDYTVIVNFI